ncbi:hypothetical protein ABZ491_28570, partial [Micromonospora rifamycinica]
MNTTILRKTALGIAGLAFTGGILAGPATHAHATTPTAVTTTVQADKPAVDKDKLIPHGVQGEQSRIDLDDEQTG